MAITYCIVCNITGEKYYGSTIRTLKVRLYFHKHISSKSCAKTIIERGDYDIYQLGEYETEKEARLKEDWYIRNKVCINKYRVIRTEEEKIKYKKDYAKKWSQRNREKINKKQRENYKKKKLIKSL